MSGFTITPYFVGCAAALVVTLVAALWDMRTGHIPNWITLPPLALAPISYGVIYGWRIGLMHVAAILVCGLVPYILFLRGGMGGGDVKLLGAVGGMLGVFSGVEAQLVAFLLGSLFAAVRLVWQGKLLESLKNAGRLLVNPLMPAEKRATVTPELMTSIRLGWPIFGGTLYAVGIQFVGPWWGVV